jgi:hypothetical protein
MTESQSTDVRPLQNAGPTMPQVGLHPRSTQDTPVTPTRSRDTEEPAGLEQWLETPEARQLVGQWVLLTRDYDVIDSAPRPSVLLDQHPEIRSPFIVFVRPRNARYVG